MGFKIELKATLEIKCFEGIKGRENINICKKYQKYQWLGDTIV